jgi:methyl-accepting chemotaxis protein
MQWPGIPLQEGLELDPSMKRNFSIRIKLTAIAIAATVGFGSLVAIGWIEGARTQNSVLVADSMSQEIAIVNAMRLANIEMTLAAMDSIIDREEGIIYPERTETIANSLSIIREGTEAAIMIAREIGRPELMETFSADLAEVADAIQIQLPKLIESRASQDEFAALDDAIDGGGERLNVNLSTLAEIGNQHVRSQLAAVTATAQETKIIQSMSALLFLLLVVGMSALIGRGIIRSLAGLRDDMQRVAAGDLECDIQGADRTDEIGLMARTLLAFREAALDKLRVDREAAQARSDKEQLDASTAAGRARDEADRGRVIEALTEGLERLSSGDLSYRINETFAPEYEKLRAEFNSSIGALNATMEEISAGTKSVHLSATEIGSASDDLSRRTEQQAASLEETAAALDEITSTVKNSSQRADEASVMASNAKKGAEKSGTVVRNAINAMEKIEESSHKISQIITVIDDIAFQTNLLALNAGVEAARAGEAGRGFAVVAQEVRELAGRSANAAKEIKTLIETSSSQVGNGVALVNETGASLGEIEVEITRINDHIQSIVTVSTEQSSTLAEINAAVNQMDQMTQQNAAMVEQTNAATQGLSGEAVKLEGLVSRFKLSPGGSVAAARPEPAPQPAPASHASRPAPSPARALGQKIANAFSAGQADAVKQQVWDEF